jgi:alpha-D-ribose 1-methylphosphonate 5-triphosphate synthase subunit PhnH
MQKPTYTAADAATYATFQALMSALSHPGRGYPLPTATGTPAIDLIAQTLLDLETTYFTPEADVARLLARTGARARNANEAAYHVYTRVDEAALSMIRHASVGTLAFPDTAATLILGCTLGAGAALRLAGPGIRTEAHLHVGGLPDDFWAVRQHTNRFPLGWDVFLVDGWQVVGLPRSTSVERR